MGMGMTPTINGRSFDGARIDTQIALGDLQVWDFVNTSGEFHPMHVHGAQFQVVSRSSASRSSPTDLGWKDTVLVHPQETVRIAIRFDGYRGRYLMHCHNLEHEDAGMMANVEVT
jgi:FtsP/CotA-like multicopper oxidase with cupredoxin domain